MHSAQEMDPVIEYLLGYVDTARNFGAKRISVVAGEVLKKVTWVDPATDLQQVCRLLESQSFQEWAGVVLVRRVGLRGTLGTIFLYNLLEAPNPAAIPRNRWASPRAKPTWRVRLRTTWWMLRPREKVALIFCPVTLLAVLAFYLLARSQQVELRWPFL